MNAVKGELGMRRFVVAGAAVLAVVGTAAVVVVVVVHADVPPRMQAVPEGPLARFYAQQIEWQPCGGDVECGDLEVPVDYAQPDGETIEMALAMLPATGDRLGTLAFNPGGPGVSGTDYVSSGYGVSPNVYEHYDVVGFDPRGVGRSAPIDCLVDADRSTRRHATPGYNAQFWRKCDQRSGDVLGHMGTADVARDLDVLRSALGENRLDYLGYSYGTQLGATYAELFPNRVGRFVLDGATDPSRSRLEEIADQAAAMQQVFERFLGDCVSSGCPFGATVDDARAQVASILREADAPPRDPSLTTAAVVHGIWYGLAERERWSALRLALARVVNDDVEHDLWVLSNEGVPGQGRADEPGHPDGDEARLVINCLDDPETATLGTIGVTQYELVRQASPMFAWYLIGELAMCRGTPFFPPPVALEYDAHGAPPILVIGSTGDINTPHVWAEALADELTAGVLVTRKGFGHTSYLRGNACIDAVVDAFFVEGTVPDDGTVCSGP